MESKASSFDNDLRKYITDENRINADLTDDNNIAGAIASSDGILQAAGVSDKVLNPDVYAIKNSKAEMLVKIILYL